MCWPAARWRCTSSAAASRTSSRSWKQRAARATVETNALNQQPASWVVTRPYEPAALACAGALRSAFRRWVNAQNVPEVLAASSVGAWLSLVVLVLVLLGAAAGGRRARGAVRPALRHLAAVLRAGAGGLRLRRAAPGAPAHRDVGVGAVADRHHVPAVLRGSLMARLRELTGATSSAGCFLFTAAFHGRLFRVTPRTPFLAVGTALALALAAFLCAAQEHRALFAVIGPAALMAEFYLGTFAVQHDRTAAEAERLRAAVQAQMLAQQERDVGRMSQALTEILSPRPGHPRRAADGGPRGGVARGCSRGAATRRAGEQERLVRQVQEQLSHIRERHGAGPPEGPPPRRGVIQRGGAGASAGLGAPERGPALPRGGHRGAGGPGRAACAPGCAAAPPRCGAWWRTSSSTPAREMGRAPPGRVRVSARTEPLQRPAGDDHRG